MTKAVIKTAPGAPLEVHDIDVAAPRAGEIAVRMAASGICHSDLWVYQNSPLVPQIHGHEASGIVEEVGEGVDAFEPGDHVIMTPLPQCGACRLCQGGFPTLCEKRAAAFGSLQMDGTSRVTLDGEPVYQQACLGAWSQYTVAPAISAVKIDREMPLLEAALIGCAVQTGFGAIANVARVRPGESVAVIGCGGVGLNAIQGARISGAERIIAVDIVDEKLDLARTFGATDTVNAAATDVLAVVRELTGGYGVDVAADFVGTPAAVVQVAAMLAPGGRGVYTGLGAAEVALPIGELIGLGKTLKGNFMGMGIYRDDFNKYVRMFQEGQLMLTELISQTIGMADVNDAFEAMENGKVARSVIKLN